MVQWDIGDHVAACSANKHARKQVSSAGTAGRFFLCEFIPGILNIAGVGAIFPRPQKCGGCAERRIKSRAKNKTFPNLDPFLTNPWCVLDATAG